jgi:hypothetical protein
MKTISIIVAMLFAIGVATPALAAHGRCSEQRIAHKAQKLEQKLTKKQTKHRVKKAKRLIAKAESCGLVSASSLHSMRYGEAGDVGAFLGGVIGGIAAVNGPYVYGPPVYRPWWRPWHHPGGPGSWGPRHHGWR